VWIPTPMRCAPKPMARLAICLAMVAVSCLLTGVYGNGVGRHGGHGGKIRPGDARSIQAALDAAPPGSRITIPAGVYVVREPLIVRKNDITIYAKGKSRSTLVCHTVADVIRSLSHRCCFCCCPYAIASCLPISLQARYSSATTLSLAIVQSTR
jgi:hypothetical protein